MSNSNHQINWGRVKKALIQEEKQLKIEERLVEERFSRLKELISNVCGEFSQNRKMAIKIGKRILFTENLTVITPCCPDYSHENGCYTFRGLGGGVSLLTQKHIEFLKKVRWLFPNTRPLFVIADAEVNDDEIRHAVGRNREEFNALVKSSLFKTQKILPSNYQVKLMTTAIPDLIEKEIIVSKQMRENQSLSSRITSETIQRANMYFKINPRLRGEEMKKRTIRTAAQYVAFGRHAEEQGYLICNHTTTSLNWYLQTRAPVLHNPTSIY